ncbi:MAG: preprotein translocase subunit SecY [Halobacteria archaeon]|nr:preprotein translocase subunit SecY [Halobacteria archaeon]
MAVRDTVESFITRMPSVAGPDRHVPFKRKLYWTFGILVLYFALTNVRLYGLVGPEEMGADLFGQFRSILAGAQGSLLQLGIGPIVTASIVLQLLDGADLLPIDTSTPRGQVLYQGSQKFLVVVMSVLTALPMAYAGFLAPSQSVAQSLGVSMSMVSHIIFIQVVIGGILILYMDEIISKWGVGSGVGLFIVAGVSQRLIGGIIDWHIGTQGVPTGILFRWYGILAGTIEHPPLASASGFQFLLLQGGGILFIFTTLLIFGIVVYAESVRVEIPLSHARVKGARGRYPVKLIYASVLPLIFVRAIQANIQMFGRILYSQGFRPGWFAVYQPGSTQPTSGVMYYLTPIQSPFEWMWWLPQGPNQAVWQILIRIGVDLVFLIIGGAIFAIFWVETADMGPEAVARQIQRSGMQIPGFRRNPAIIEKVMARYIPQITIIGGVILGVLAAMANLLGTIGGVTGTGLLLTISIVHKLYEEIAEEQLMEMHPMMRRMFASEG